MLDGERFGSLNKDATVYTRGGHFLTASPLAKKCQIMPFASINCIVTR